MSNQQNIGDHYAQATLLSAIKAGIAKLGKTNETVQVEDLAPVDEFHIGGRQATVHLMNQLGFGPEDHVLDVGCGLGGAARFVASATQAKVSGVDATADYVSVGNVLNGWVGLDDQIKLLEGFAQSMPFDGEMFDGAYIIHVGMNFPDKVEAYREINRVLKPGALFGIYDIMQKDPGEIAYPVPWASEPSLSHLRTADAYQDALTSAGFKVLNVNSRYDFALDFFAQIRAKAVAGGNSGPAPLGLHLLMGESTPAKIGNMVGNLQNGLIAPVEIIAQKPV
ncbi:MAG: class I SAM-dependent methyltransferase [Anaerolineae bacterium]